MAKIESFGRSFRVYADCVDAMPPVEVYSIEKQKSRLVTASDNLIDYTKEVLSNAVSLLPYFAEKYRISADLKDYVIVPVIIMPSDLPNRNVIAFPYEELIAANPDVGMLGYQTWKFKPTFVEHKNNDYTKAKGVILESSLRPIKGAVGSRGTPLYKVLNLCAFDRRRDPGLVNSILTGERQSYSMGAMTSYFTCSICGAMHHKRGEIRCEHISLDKPVMRKMPDGKLIYLKAHNFVGFETSSVKVPAYHSATTPVDSILQVASGDSKV